MSTAEGARIRALERENHGLRRTNELKRAAAFFGAELDRKQHG